MSLNNSQNKNPSSLYRLSHRLSIIILFLSYGFLGFLIGTYIKNNSPSFYSYASPVTDNISQIAQVSPFNWESYSANGKDILESLKLESINKGSSSQSFSSESITSQSDASSSLSPIPFQINSILGQPNDKETMVNRIVPNRGFLIGGVHLDSQNRIYVLDSGNNRILGFNSYVGPDQSADIVIGQPQLTDSGSANGNNTAFTQPTDRTLAFQRYPNLISTLESPKATHMATDSEDNLYVADTENNRILKFNSPFTTDTIADEVWGQSDFTSRMPSCGQNGMNPTASTFCFGHKGIEGLDVFMSVLATGITIDTNGNLWVSDAGNLRVLRFPNNNGTIAKNADLVLGQPNFTSRNYPNGFTKSMAQMQEPIAVKVKPSTGEVYVLEGNWVGQARIMVFSPPFTNGMSASREVARAHFQDSQPGDTTNWEFTNGKWVNLVSGIHWTSSFEFDPSLTGDFFALDPGNQRVVLFGTDGSIIDTLYQPNANSRGCLGTPDRGFVQVDGTMGNLCMASGEIGVDTSGNIYISTIAVADQKDIARFATPLVRDSNGHVISNGSLLHKGRNQYSGRTFEDVYGMSRSSGQSPQLFVSDHQRLLVWNNATNPATFSQADYVIGQDSFDQNNNNNWGTFHSIDTGGQAVDPNGYLYVQSASRIFVFTLPITSGGKNYPAYKMLFSNSTNSSQNVVWADDGTPVTFDPAGIAFEASSGALFISDPPRQRILRIRDPLGQAKVDLVIGQPNKSASSPNAGNPAPVRNGLYNPTYLSFDNFSNLYVVDASYEMNGNRRALRFDASALNPVPSNIFPLPNASAVFSKSSFTTTSGIAGQPASPVTLGFDQNNRMVMVADGYGNTPFERVFVYNTPHIGEIINADNIVQIPVAQGGAVRFNDNNDLILQDHTWNRILFTTLSFPPTPTSTLQPSPTSAPSQTPIPTPTLTKTPTPIPLPTATPLPTSTPPPASIELLLNPGFENDSNNNGKPDNWSTNNRFTKNNTLFHSGASSGLHFSSSNSGYNIDQTILNIVGNASYNFSAWTNIPATSDTFTYKIQLRWRNSGGSIIRTDTIKTYTSQTSGWNNALATKTAPANSKSVLVRMALTSLKGPIYVDDFSLTK